MTKKLEGLTILVPESRELDLFAGMLEVQGAKTLRCPLVTICDVEDEEPVKVWLSQLVSGAFDDLILLTGEGLMRLLAHAERLGLKQDAVTAIAQLRTIVRGPKPTRALREIGLGPGIVAGAPTSQGVIESLRGLDIGGRVIGLQLYPSAPDELATFLERAGAVVTPVTPYRYASRAEDARVAQAIEQMASGEIDFVAFTSSPQVKRLLDVARERGIEDKLRTAFAKTRIAAIGPVVSAAVEAAGAKVAVQPANFHLKPFVAAIAEAAKQ